MFTPQTAVEAKVFFASIFGQDDNDGLILDNVSLKAVPLARSRLAPVSG